MGQPERHTIISRKNAYHGSTVAAASLGGIARAMAGFASAGVGGSARDRAMVALRDAMIAHPELVSGKGRSCAALMDAANGQAAVKTGAEGFFAAILPGKKLGVALKIEDGATRASEAAMAAILVRLGIVDAEDPRVRVFLTPRIENRDGLHVGDVRPTKSLLD